MFTGLTQPVSLFKVVKKSGGLILTFTKPAENKLKIGDSVDLNGICSTVVKQDHRHFQVEYMAETLRVTTAKFWKAGDAVNFESSLRLGDELGGHFVFGHVDCRGLVMSGGKNLKISFPKKFSKFVVIKGSISIDGVSLTVSSMGQGWVGVSLIPHTLKNTNLHILKKGDKVNLEFDQMAKYLYKISCKSA